jgi:metal-dependent hydrolase (beta-lactamase superfamily II)
LEKFLKVCWHHDKLSGEANFNIDNNYEEGTLFAQLGENVKKDTVSKEIENLILSRKLYDNKSGLKYVLSKGCEPKLFTEVVQKLMNDKKIEIVGKFNKQSTNIHRIKETYQIKRI